MKEIVFNKPFLVLFDAVKIEIVQYFFLKKRYSLLKILLLKKSRKNSHKTGILRNPDTFLKKYLQNTLTQYLGVFP